MPRKARQLAALTPKPPGTRGRPRKKVSAKPSPALKSTRSTRSTPSPKPTPAPPTPATPQDFSDRAAAEALTGALLNQINDDYTLLRDSYRANLLALDSIMTASGDGPGSIDVALIQLLDSTRRAFSRLVDQRRQFADTLLKRFELLAAQLTPPEEQDERFAPVTFQLSPTPPPPTATPPPTSQTSPKRPTRPTKGPPRAKPKT